LIDTSSNDYFYDKFFNTMNKFCFLVFTFFIPLLMNAQSESRVAKTLKGKVVNSLTNEAIAYTNIGIEDTFYGTASDADGDFQLKIPEEMLSKQIFFSAIGYTNETYPVASLSDREFFIVKLKPQSYDIEDVDVAAQSRVLMRILRMASENTPYNFMGGPFNLICSLENDKVIDDTIRYSTTAEVVVYDRSGYQNPSKDEAFAMRKYEIKSDEPDYSFASGMINFDELLEMDWVRLSGSVLNPALLSQFELSLVAETEVNEVPVWVIAFSQEEPTLAGSQDFHATSFEGTITIAKDDYSVEKIEGKATAPLQHRQGKTLAVTRSVVNHLQDVTYDFKVSYARLVPQTIALNKQYTHQGKRVRERSLLSIDGVNVSQVREISARDYFVE
jgi:hypothetical protein